MYNPLECDMDKQIENEMGHPDKKMLVCAMVVVWSIEVAVGTDNFMCNDDQ